jgi:hypothetical protein
VIGEGDVHPRSHDLSEVLLAALIGGRLDFVQRVAGDVVVVVVVVVVGSDQSLGTLRVLEFLTRAIHRLLLETSAPGIFAVGNRRSESVNRRASAVGEGAVAFSLVHRVLGE